jgi:hypothetical protein
MGIHKVELKDIPDLILLIINTPDGNTNNEPNHLKGRPKHIALNPGANNPPDGKVQESFGFIPLEIHLQIIVF